MSRDPSGAPPADAPVTRQRILAAAERLFAKHGYEACSVRAITQEARANTAAVHYHFRSKEGLLRAVLERRLRPVNEERLRLLNQAELESGVRPAVERVLEALVAPPFRVFGQGEGGGMEFVRFIGRVLLDPDPTVQEIVLDQFREIAGRFAAAFRRALPDLPSEEVYWRMHFAIGALAHTMCDAARIRYLSGGLCQPGDVEATVSRLVRFLAAGMRAPSEGTPEVRA